MATTYNEDGSQKIRNAVKKSCPPGFYRDKNTGRCVQAGVGPEYKP